MCEHVAIYDYLTFSQYFEERRFAYVVMEPRFNGAVKNFLVIKKGQNVGPPLPLI